MNTKPGMYPNKLDAAKGLLIAAAIALPIWAVIIYLIVKACGG